MTKGIGLLSAVDTAAKNYRERMTWFDCLKDDARDELLAARKKWHAGGYSLKRLTLARLIVKAAKDRGWKVCDSKRMSEWLAKND